MSGSFKITPGGPEESVARLEAVGRLMDGAFVLPGTNIRLGLDAIIGLVPVAGDVISGLVSSYLIWEARQLGAPRWLIARMMANTFLDTTLGVIPLVGDAFYTRVRQAHTIVATGEPRLYGNVIVRKGVIRPGGTAPQ